MPSTRDQGLHNEILWLVAAGLNSRKIADKVGCSDRLVRKVWAMPEYTEQIEEYKRQLDAVAGKETHRIRQRVPYLAGKILNKLEHEIEKGQINEKRVRVFRETLMPLLDRCGVGPVKQLPPQVPEQGPDSGTDLAFELMQNAEKARPPEDTQVPEEDAPPEDEQTPAQETDE